MFKITQLRNLFKSSWLWFFSLHFAVLFAWWLAFFPGVMSPDSITQWEQAGTWAINDTHPYLHTVIIGLLRLIWNSPGVVSFAQIILTAALVATIFNFLWKNGVPRFLVKLFYIVTLLSLPLGIYSVTLWKDVPFSLALIAVSCFLFQKIYAPSVWRLKDILILVILSVLVIQLRHNGMVYVLFLPLLVGLAFRKVSISWIYPCVLLPVFLFFHFLLPSVLHVQDKDFWLGNFFIYHNTAGFYARLPDAYLTPASRAMMDRILPANEIKLKYDPTYVDHLYWNPNLNTSLYNSKEFWEVLTRDFYYSNLWHNFDLFLNDRFLLFSHALTGQGMTYGISIVQNDLGLASHSLMPDLQVGVSNLLLWISKHSFFRSLVWSSWLGLILLAFLFFYALCKRIVSLLVFSFILLIQAPVLFLVSPVADWRFFFFFYIALLFIVPLCFLPNLGFKKLSTSAKNRH